MTQRFDVRETLFANKTERRNKQSFRIEADSEKDAVSWGCKIGLRRPQAIAVGDPA